MKKTILLLTVLCIGTALHGLELEYLVGTERAAILLEGVSVGELQTKDPSPLLLPNLSDVQNFIQSVQRSFDPNIMVESLYLYTKPIGANPGEWTDIERTAVYNHSLALSSLAGIEYYSTSRRKMRTFYETSRIIDNPESKNPRPDPVYQIPPNELLLYANQEDLTFGDNIYRYTYYAENEYMMFVQENLTSMNAGIIPAIGKNNLRSVVAVIDAEEHLLLYVVSMADAVMIPGMSRRIGQSFSTRAEAILHWFSGQADRAFQSAGGNP